MSDPDLVSYLEQVLPKDFSYEDAVKLHVRLFCTVDGVPSDLHSQCSRPGLSQAFAALAQVGRLRCLPAGIAATEPKHWSWILDEFPSGRIALDLELEWPPKGAP